MKQVLQNRKTGRPFVGEVPAPALQRGRVLVRTVASLISAGTERAAVELVSKGLVQEARERPDLVKQVVAKVKSEGLLNTFTAVRDGMAEKVAQNPYGMLAAAFAVGYVAGGGLFTKTTARMVQLGARLAMIPQVRDPLLDMAEKVIDGVLERTKPQGP